MSDRTSVDLVCDADFLTREKRLIASLAADGIDIGIPTRAHFAIEDMIATMAYQPPTADECLDCGAPLTDWEQDNGYEYCLQCRGPRWDTIAERDGLR